MYFIVSGVKNLQSQKSAFSLNAFCSERLKEIAEKAGGEIHTKQQKTAIFAPESSDNKRLQQREKTLEKREIEGTYFLKPALKL